MSKRIVFVGLILVLLLSACGLPGGKTAKAEEPVAAPTVEAQLAQPVEPTLPPPTVEVAPPTAEPVEPAEPAPTEEPAQPEGFNFREEFDLGNDSFSEDIITTTQATTRDRMQTEPSSVQDGILKFNIRDNETYIYKFVNGSSTVDSIIEAKWKSNGQSMNGVSLLCRAAEDYSSWYEFRMSSQGEWNMLRYDKSIRDNDPYKNPYVTLKKGLAKSKLVRVSGDNTSKFSCIGSKLTYEINGTKVMETNNNDIPSGGMVGLGSMSAVYLPVVIMWDYFSVTTP
jgi:hypothetical protein